jgi:hypothetical protein
MPAQLPCAPPSSSTIARCSSSARDTESRLMPRTYLGGVIDAERFKLTPSTRPGTNRTHDRHRTNRPAALNQPLRPTNTKNPTRNRAGPSNYQPDSTELAKPSPGGVFRTNLDLRIRQGPRNHFTSEGGGTSRWAPAEGHWWSSCYSRFPPSR